MTRLQLRFYVHPGEAQIFCNLLRKDGKEEKITATIDTGAAICLFPTELLDVIVYGETTKLKIDQAGIANQYFEAIQTLITISLEDEFGNMTNLFQIPAWFGATTISLIGFAGVLDRSVLHLDSIQQTGWLDIDV